MSFKRLSKYAFNLVMLVIVVLYVFVDNRRMLTFILLMCISLFIGFSVIVRARWWNIVLTPIVISPLALVVIRYTLENGNPAGILDPATQSWAMLYGDSIVIPCALLAANYAWPGTYEGQGFFASARWGYVSLLSGIALAWFWNLVLDAPNYIRYGHGDLLLSPSHLWHGCVTFPVLAGALINYGVPIIIKWWRRKPAWLFFALLVCYIGLSIADGTIHPLDVTNLHPPVSQTWLGGG